MELIPRLRMKALSVTKLGRDELVASLLILYGLHPVDLEARVAAGAR